MFRKDPADRCRSLLIGCTSIETLPSAARCSVEFRSLCLNNQLKARPFLFVSVTLFLMLNTGARSPAQQSQLWSDALWVAQRLILATRHEGRNTLGRVG